MNISEQKEKRQVVGWALFLTGLASTIPIALRVFGRKQATATATVKPTFE